MSPRALFVIVLFIALGAGAYYYSGYTGAPLSPQATTTSAVTDTDREQSSPASLCEAAGGTFEYSVNECVLPLVVVASPAEGELVASPLIVSGKARGYWFFEASFPLEITDSAGTVLGRGHASAQGEWMTQDYVPFTGTLTFTPPQSGDGRGFVVFKKDNPSGLPENDDSLRVAVRFR